MASCGGTTAAATSGVPRDAYWSTGKNNNHTLVVPSLDLVAVRVGTDGWSNHGGNHAQFFKPICDAVVGMRPAPDAVARCHGGNRADVAGMALRPMGRMMGPLFPRPR